MHRMKWMMLLAALAGGCRATGARSDTWLFTLEDPRGDDHGDGELRYPLRPDMRKGDLDIVSLVAHADGGGTRFEATFARPIAMPDKARSVDLEGGTQAELARHGFYTFNLDIYVDMDGVEGSGRTDTLPGRNLALASRSGWEKVVVLTPRPYEAKEALRGVWLREAQEQRAKQGGGLSESEGRALEAEVTKAVDSRVFVASRIRVSGKTVSFVVPKEFFGGVAQPTWGYAVAVTGSVLDRRVDIPALFGAQSQASQGLMVMGIGPGDSQSRFGGGRRGEVSQSPVVDLMVPSGVRQEEVLGPGGPVWPAVVPAGPRVSEPQGEALPQAPEAGAPSGQGDAPSADAP